MSKEKTIFSELTIALGITSGNFNKIDLQKINNVDAQNISIFLNYYQNNHHDLTFQKNANNLYNVGISVRDYFNNKGIKELTNYLFDKCEINDDQ